MKKIESISEYQIEYQKSVENPELFWEEKALSFKWNKKWSQILKWEFETPEVNWFIGAKLNITENCLDRHLEKNANKLLISMNIIAIFIFCGVEQNIILEREKVQKN